MSLCDCTAGYPLEYCAARFLRQWEQREEALHASISGAAPSDSIVEALRYFQVARNFRGLAENKDQSVSSDIRSALITTRSDKSLASPIAKVEALAQSLELKFGQYNLSAATKLLWLSCRAPIIVYDKRAVRALSKHAHHMAIAGRYAAFTTAWRSEYEALASSIQVAVENLSRGRLFMPKTSYTDTQLVALSKQAWFTERVFDIFLWEVGGDG
ncbi:hypothetical protein [Azoarcus taiwanensis]|uniref:EGF-like domain-containing protein n=1 Tax=Azoarcus taiwanensis TaxID=666964 RepID=A0A972JD26_9RHOO|nr:hypothetical protein [Azoarcus taiwanensis]NMG05092.1 hypothetical protein [Azoarcus taiwanensis]